MVQMLNKSSWIKKLMERDKSQENHHQRNDEIDLLFPSLLQFQFTICVRQAIKQLQAMQWAELKDRL